VTWSSGAKPVIVLNKADVAPDLDAQQDEVRAIAIGVPIHAISAKAQHGLDALAPYLQPGQTIALLGSSGVGKSTIINRLLGTERQRTKEVRASDQRGRHTTTHRELVPLPGGALLIDTPGMRELQLWSADEGLQETFDDIEARAADCFFKDCGHDSEPRCAVKAAVAEGTIPEERLQSYLKLQREQRQLAARQDALAQQAIKRQARAGAKALQKRIQEKGRD
jgi:ribosome biogenesis GTPase